MKTIKLKEIIGNDIRSRISINVIKSYMSELHNDYIIDMSGIIFISRSFADELYTLKMNYEKLLFVNQTDNVRKMMNVVWEGRQSKRVRNNDSADIEDLKTIDDFKEFLMSF